MSIYQKSSSIYSLKYNNINNGNLNLFSRKYILKYNYFNNNFNSLKYWLSNCFNKCNIENDNNYNSIFLLKFKENEENIKINYLRINNDYYI